MLNSYDKVLKRNEKRLACRCMQYDRNINPRSFTWQRTV